MANTPLSRAEDILQATIDGTSYDDAPQSRVENLLIELKEVIEEGGGGGGGGTNNYNHLSNQPQIEGVTLIGNKTASDLGLATSSDLSNKVNKVPGKTLSTNDYSDTDKAIVDGVATALNDKVDKNGTDRLMTVAEGTKLAGIEAGAEVNVQSDWNQNTNTEKDYIKNKPDLSGFITKSVNDLVNYYLKTETYTKSEVNSLISAISTIHFEFVSTLPTTDIQTNVIYLVPKPSIWESNVKDEYINLDGTTTGWEKIGNTEIDLSDYVTITALNTILDDYVQRTEIGEITDDQWVAITALLG